MEEERTGLGGGFDERGTVEYKTPPREESDDEFDDLGRRKKKYKMPYKKPMIAQSVPDPPSEPEEEEEEEEDDEEEEDVPLDLSNKGSTPGASPSMMERDEAEQHPMNLANYSQLPYNFTTTMLQSSSDEEDNSLLPVPAQCDICSKVFTKRSSFKRHMSDHKGRNASSSSSKCCTRRK